MSCQDKKSSIFLNSVLSCICAVISDISIASSSLMNLFKTQLKRITWQIFQLLRTTQCLSATKLYPCSAKAVTDNKLMNSCSCMYNINLTYGHTFKFHVIFMCHRILSFFYFQPSKSILHIPEKNRQQGGLNTEAYFSQYYFNYQVSSHKNCFRQIFLLF